MKGAGGARSAARRQKRREQRQAEQQRRGSARRQPGVGGRGSTLSDDADSTTDSGESARVATAVKGGSQAAEASGLLEADTHENELLSDGGGGVERGQEQRSSFQAEAAEWRDARGFDIRVCGRALSAVQAKIVAALCVPLPGPYSPLPRPLSPAAVALVES